MSQQIIQEFWNSSGVLGVALIPEQEEPYFYVKKRIVDWEKQALIKMILQIVAKSSKRIDLFDFKVMGYHAYAYKLNSNLTLVVLTLREISAINSMAAAQLRPAIQENIEDALKTFDILISKTAIGEKKLTVAPTAVDPKLESSNSFTEPAANIEDLVNALNCISKFIINYMGVKLTANYWQLSRPNFKWLENFQINHSAKIAFSGVIAEPVTAEQHQWVKEWTGAFIKRCSQIVQDLPSMIEKKCLDEEQKKLLLTPRGSELTRIR